MTDSPWAALWRRLPLWLSSILTLVAVVQAHRAFSGGLVFTLPLALTIAVIVAAVVTVSLTTEGLQVVPRTLPKEAVGATVLMAALFALIVLSEVRILPAPLRPWQIIVGGVAAFLFLAQSQRSFLLVMGLDSFLMIASLLEHPRIEMAGIFAVLQLLLTAVLFHREKVEEAAREQGAHLAVLVSGAPAMTAVGALLLAACWWMQPGEEALLAERIRLGRPALARTLSTGGALDRAMPTDPQDDPFERAPSEAGGAVGGSVMSLETDLKFGDSTDGGGHPYTVAMYVELRDEAGRRTDGGGAISGWTAGAVSRYDGREWIADPSPPVILRDRDDGAEDGWIRLPLPFTRVPTVTLEQRTILFPMAGRSLFTASPVMALKAAEAGQDAEGILVRTQESRGRCKYTSVSVVARPSPGDLDEMSLSSPDKRYLEVPASFSGDPVVRETAAQVRAQAATPAGRIRAVIARLSQCRYTLSPELRPGADPTVEFLRLGRGYCQHFASAMTLLLRMMDIPARISVGFSRGDWNAPDGIYIVRRRHAHAWVEVPFEGAGWVPFDPTGHSLDDIASRIKPPDDDPIAKGDPRPPTPSTPVRPGPIAPLRPSPSPGPSGSAGPGPSGDPSSPPDRESPAGPARPSEFDALWEAVENHRAEAASPDPGRSSSPSKGASKTPAPAEGRAKRVIAEILLGLWRSSRDILLLTGAMIAAAVFVFRALKARRRKQERRAVAALPGEQFLGGDTRRGRPPVLLDALPRGSRRRRIVELYLDLAAKLAERGLGREPWQTSQEYLASLSARLMPSPPGLRAITGLFEAARYGEGDVEPARLKDAERIHNETMAQLRRMKR